MATTNITIRIDKELKQQADELFADLGLNLTTAITAFVRQAVRDQKIPFVISREQTASSDAVESNQEIA